MIPKFLLYDKEYGMCLVEEIHYFSDEVITVKATAACLPPQQVIKSVTKENQDILRRAIGRVDKNGVEIFSGDVIKVVNLVCDMSNNGIADMSANRDFCAGHTLKEIKRFVATCELDYENDLIYEVTLPRCFDDMETYEAYKKEVSMVGLEIIGNVYQHPHLIADGAKPLSANDVSEPLEEKKCEEQKQS
jgi:uncharacterized phage protein (TIGR01671 family)